jgi:hypothetical protein
MMVDEIFDRSYQSGRADLNAGMARGFTKLGNMLSESFAVLHRIEWSAPWHRKGKRA